MTEACDRCNRGVLEQRAGAQVCSWCGIVRYEFNAVSFETLYPGHRFMGVGDKRKVVFVKAERETVGQDGYHWNAYREDAPHLHANFGPLAPVVIV